MKTEKIEKAVNELDQETTTCIVMGGFEGGRFIHLRGGMIDLVTDLCMMMHKHEEVATLIKMASEAFDIGPQPSDSDLESLRKSDTTKTDIHVN